MSETGVCCPSCRTSEHVTLTSPDYGSGASFRCYGCNPYGLPFSSSSSEALAASGSAKAASAAYAAKLREASRPIVATFVRASLASAKAAGKNYNKKPSASKCSTSCGLAKSDLAYAHAYWYIAESALATLGASPDQLKAVRDMVDPATVTARRDTGTKFAAAVKAAVESAGFNYRKEIYLC